MRQDDADRLMANAQIAKGAVAQSIKTPDHIYTAATAVICYVVQGTAT